MYQPTVDKNVVTKVIFKREASQGLIQQAANSFLNEKEFGFST